MKTRVTGRRWIGILGALALALPVQAQESFRVAGDRVAIYNIAGRVEVVSGTGNEVVVELRRGGRDAERLTVETGTIDGRNTLRVIYPDDRIVYPAGQGNRWRSVARVRSDGTFGGGSDRGSPVEVNSSGSGLEAWADLRIVVPASTTALEVHSVRGSVIARNLATDLVIDSHGGEIEVDGLRGDLLVDTGSGSVDVRGVRGSVEVDTGSGGVTIRDIEGELVYLDTGSGRVQADDVRAATVEIDTGSGSIVLGALASPVILVDTGSGGVEIEVLGRVDTLEVDTGSGGVTLRLPADLDAEIEADTGSGGIDVDFEVEVDRVSRDYFRGRVGSGRGRILIDTGSGRIRLIGG